jgi:ribonucleoside-triphosphate reductase
MKVIKRSGQEVEFDPAKIERAIERANDSIETKSKRIGKRLIHLIATEIAEAYENSKKTRNVEYIQDLIENKLIEYNAYAVAKEYITYRYKRTLARKSNSTDNQILALIECNNEEIKQENSNKNPVVGSTQRDYIAGEVSKDLTRRILLSDDIVEAHDKGIIHFHDADYFAQHIFNCCLINLEDMLENGTVISGTMIEKPHSFSTACNIATQIIAQVASNQYGGQTISLAHLAPFVDISRQKIKGTVEEELSSVYAELEMCFDEVVEEITEKRIREEIKKGIQTIQYQVVTLMTTNGQAPFLSINMYLNEAKNEDEKEDLALIIEEVLRQRIEGVKNEKGVWVTPAFPKLLYVLQDDNIHKGDKYYYLTELAAKCTAKRMVPDYISEKKMKEYKIDKNGEGQCYPCMGCRSFLTPWTTKEDLSGSKIKVDSKYYGRFNQGVVTINLVDAGLAAEKDLDKFWNVMDERLELCHKALQLRHERLAQTTSDVSPIHWQHGAIARLDKGESIHKLLHDGYSTISLGYAGLWECVYALIGKKLTEPEGEELGLKIMQLMNDKCNEWKVAENIDYSLYGTPLESTTYKFAKAVQERYGIIEGVTDKNYITNSYHIHVTEEIDAFSKLTTEAKFQKLSPGGAISYIEVPNMQHNIEAVITVIQFIYDNIMYAELNTKSDYCHICSYDDEIEIQEDENGKLYWRCPNCGNTDQSKMNVARRTCGYIGSQYWNQGRTQEIRERVLHL